MLALLSIWIGLASFVLAATMFIYRPAMTDLNILLVLYFGAPGALCLAGITLWANRADVRDDPAVTAQRLQSKVAIVFAIAAAIIVYALIIGSKKIE